MPELLALKTLVVKLFRNIPVRHASRPVSSFMIWRPMKYAFVWRSPSSSSHLRVARFLVIAVSLILWQRGKDPFHRTEPACLPAQIRSSFWVCEPRCYPWTRIMFFWPASHKLTEFIQVKRLTAIHKGGNCTPKPLIFVLLRMPIAFIQAAEAYALSKSKRPAW